MAKYIYSFRYKKLRNIIFLLPLFIAFSLSAQTWQQTNGPGGGIIRTFAVSGTNIFAGTAGGGVYLSINNGASWTSVNNGLTTPFVLALAVSGTNIFAGTGVGVFLSTNNGISWTQDNNGLLNTSVASLAVIGTNIFVGTSGGGVFLSTNNGSSWTAVNNGLTNSYISSLEVEGTYIFAGTNGGGVFLSTNNGSSWTAVNNGLTVESVTSLAVSGIYIFAGTANGGGTGIFMSTNNGASWTAVNNGLTNGFVSSLAVSGSNIFAGTTSGGVFLSTNNGSSWTAVNSGLTNSAVISLAVSGSNIFAGTEVGVYLSINNGASWMPVNNGLTNTSVRSFTVSGTNIFAGTYNDGAFLSTDNGASWTAVNNGLSNLSVYSLAVSGTNIFAGTGGGVYLSTNNGASWTSVNNGLTNATVQALTVSGNNIFAGTGAGVFLSTNNGSSWTQDNNGLLNTSVASLAVSGTNIFAGTGGGVYLSTNNGASWTSVNNGLTNATVQALTVSGNNIFAGINGGVFFSANNGSSWALVNNGLTQTNVNSITVSGNNILAGTTDGIFLSTNNGSSWTPDYNGLTNTDVLSLAVSGTNIFAGTNGSGVFLSTITSASLPTVLTSSVTNITMSTATLNGSTNPNGTSTSVQFDYGTTTSYGSSAAATQSPVSGTSNVSISAYISGLAPNTVYHYRVEATNSAGTSYGLDSTFSTLNVQSAPTVTTTGATNISSSSSTLNGIVNPHVSSTSVQFDYGTTTNYTGAVTATQSPVVGSFDVNESANISGLAPNTLYHYRVEATNSAGTSYGADSTFTTLLNAQKFQIGDQVQANSNLNIRDTVAGNLIAQEPSGGLGILIQGPVYQIFNSIYYYWYKVKWNDGKVGWSIQDNLTKIVVYPEITSVSPNPVVGSNNSEAFYINGSNFQSGCTVTLRDLTAGSTYPNREIILLSSSQIQLNVNFTTSADYWSVEIINPDGPSSGQFQFKVISPQSLPYLTTLNATNVSTASSTLNGFVNPNGLSTIVQFDYGTTGSYGTTITALPSPVTGDTNVNVSANISSLAPGTTYHFRVEATNSAGTSYGTDSTFTTLNGKSLPIVSTLSAINVAATSSTLNGLVYPNGSSSTVQFDYGTTISYGSTITASQSPVTGISNENVSANIINLTPGIIYHYRVEATNSSGTSYGTDSTFTTLNGKSLPIVSTLSAINVTATSSTLNGLVYPNGSSSTVQFDYGTTTSYGSTITALQSPVTGISNENVSANIINLTPGIIYHYRVESTNSSGTSYGLDSTFSTLNVQSVPTVTTTNATNISSSSCTLNGIVNPHVSSTSVQFDYGTTTNYTGAVTATQSPVLGSFDVNESANISGLASNTLYHYRIEATNSAGTTYGADSIFTTLNVQSKPTVTTENTLSITTTSSTLNGLVNANGASSIVQFDYGTTTSYGTSITASQSPVTGITNANVSSNINSLTPGTIYHFRVEATNSAGTSYGADSTFTTLILSTVSTFSPTNVNINTATLNGMVNPNGTNTNVQFDYGITTSYGNATVVSQSPITGNNNTNVSSSISGLNSNTLYHYRIEAANNAGTSYGSDKSFQTYSTTTNLSYVYSFGDISQSNNYQLIGIPGSNSIPLSNILNGTAKQDWVAFYDNGNTTNYLMEFDNSSLFSFSPGNGFWILSKNGINLSQTVSNVSIDVNSNYSIPLHPGWNIISNPFNITCSWNSIIALNSLSSNAVIYSWSNGNWLTSSNFSPYIGYYFYNSANVTSLIIPYNAAGTLSKISASNIPQQQNSYIRPGDKYIEISLLLNGIKKTSAFAVINPKSTEGYDQYDYLAPPSDFENESIVIINDTLSISYKKLLKDSRPKIGNGEAFDFMVTNKKGSQLELNFGGVNTFNDYECYLMDLNSKQFFNLKDDSTISINGKKTSNYVLLIGKDSYIAEKKADNTPGNYLLFQNYPNPFNPSTTIRYALPFNSNIKIEVYNILGEKIKELVNGQKNAGYYEVNFNTTGLASGVYFYLIEARSLDGMSEFRDTKKMMFLK